MMMLWWLPLELGYDVKRVMVDQGSSVEIMNPDLYKGLGLKPEDLTTYSSPLISFEGKMVVPKGQIRLPVQASTDVVEVDFIVVEVDHYGQALATLLGRCFIHPSPEGKISLWRTSVGNSRKSVCG